MAPACQARIIPKYNRCIQLLNAVNELCVPSFVDPDEIGDRWMTFRRCSIDIIRLLSRVIVSVLPAFVFESLPIFSGSPYCSNAHKRMLHEMLRAIV